jgi:hypothetical protein
MPNAMRARTTKSTMIIIAITSFSWTIAADYFVLWRRRDVVRKSGGEKGGWEGRLGVFAAMMRVRG